MIDTERAFPSVLGGRIVGGLSIRDWFAGMAMQGIAAMGGMANEEDTAKFAYGLADAMIKERTK